MIPPPALIGRRRRFRWLACLPLASALLGGLPSAGVCATVLPGFAVENAFPGVHFILPTAIAFLPDGRLLVAEKRGVVWVVEGGTVRSTPLWSAEKEVLGNGDRGLVGLAVDPAFAINHRVYFYYTVDPDSNGVDDNTGAFTRLTRYTTSAADSHVVDPGSRTVLIGQTWGRGIPSPSLSHAVDCIRFGTDGSLLVSHGDGSHFEYPDAGGHDPNVFLPGRTDPIEDIGSFRSQFLGSLAGKLLRINPDNGNGYASNPYATGDLTAARSKVWAYGLRNPFRFFLRPGTGSADTAAGDPGRVVIGDVGAAKWEELDLVETPGMNFGWPCREGDETYAVLAGVTPTHHGCASVGDIDNPVGPSAPRFLWSHTDSTRSRPYGITGNCTSGGIFYTGSRYPESWRGRLFFGDYGGGWLKVATLDDANQIASLQDFASGLEAPVDWAMDPVSGELCYAAIVAGEVRRIRYTGDAGATQVFAQASAAPIAVVAPASVSLSSLGSYDAGGGAIQCTWSFGDGTPGSTAPHPMHVYATAGEYEVILTVTRLDGALARDTLRIVALRDSGVVVTPVLDAFEGVDRPLGSPWVGNISGLAIRDHALVQNSVTSYAMWGESFGANQEVHFRFDSISATAPEHDLLLKVQGASWTSGAIQVVYDATGSVIAISTYTPVVGWAHIAGPWRDIHFEAGDTFSARALSNGLLEVHRNGDKLGDCRVDTWAFSRGGGRIGLMLRGAAASRLAAFGGGTLSVRDNVPPVATILEPLDGAFFTEDERVRLRGEGHDTDGPDSTLRYHWGVSIHHNNHLHPDVMTSEAAIDSFTAENHDDGTGIALRVRLIVTDARGAADTAEVVIHPEVNLVPENLALDPARPVGGDAHFAFTLVNHGSMPAPGSRWRLRLDGAVVAEGEAVVPAYEGVLIEGVLPAPAVAGHLVRAEVDVMNTAHETHESDNATEVVWAPLAFPTSRVRDAFERGEGVAVAPGSPWLGSLSGLWARDLALVQTAPTSYAIWNGGTFAADQEAFVRFDSVTATAPEHSLLLKVQRTTWTGGALQVAWSAVGASVSIYTYSPTAGWVRRGGPWQGVRFEPGDQFGARATAVGTVTAFRNGVAIGTASLGDWEFAALGGRIGLMLRGANRTRLIDFGGGDVVDASFSPPQANVLAPAPQGVVPAGDSLVLQGTASDAEDDATVLRHRWRVAHGGTAFTALGPRAAWAIPPDATGALRVDLVVTDPTGRRDTASVMVRVGAGTLDRFQRADGPPGASWVGSTTAFAIRDSALVSTGAAGYLTQDIAPFGADQEAWMEFDSVTATAPEHDLLLKVQGRSWTSGALQVTYAAAPGIVVLNTYTPGAGWTRRAGPWPVALGAGDRFGARAYADGRVQVLKNGVPVGEGSVAAWSLAANGGRVGIILNGAVATRITRFGGGTFVESAASLARSRETPAAAPAATPAVALGAGSSSNASPRLSAAMPNPVRHDAAFALALARAASVRLDVYDLMGRIVWSAPARELGAGEWTLRWPAVDGRGAAVPMGVYVARVTIDGAPFLRRLTIVR